MNSIQNYGMASNYGGLQKRNNVSFGAKFRKDDIEKLLNDVEPKNSFIMYPTIYTCLERLDEIKPGSIAELSLGDSHGGGWSTPTRYPKITINGTLFHENIGGDRGPYWYTTLQEPIKNGIPNTGNIPIMGIPSRIYDEKLYEHRNVTVDDIRKFAYDA